MLLPAGSDTTTVLRTLQGGRYGNTDGINDSGTVIGWSENSLDGGLAAVWAPDGSVSALPNLPGAGGSSAEAINDAGEIAGVAATASGNDHAVVRQ